MSGKHALKLSDGLGVGKGKRQQRGESTMLLDDTFVSLLEDCSRYWQ